MRRVGIVLLALCVSCWGGVLVTPSNFSSLTNNPYSSVLSAEAYGAIGDGSTDDSSAIQSALNAAGASVGNSVKLLSKQYKIAGTLSIPTNVTLLGSSSGSAAHNQNIGTPDSLSTGTTLLITGGSGTSESATATISVGINGSIKNLKMYWPNQSRTAGTPTQYPYAIRFTAGTISAAQGGGLVEDVELVNPYNGIDIESSRVSVNRVFGQPINKGIKIDNSADVDRLTNIHFNPYWSYATNLYTWQQANGVGLDIADAQGVMGTNIFAMGYKTGFWFHDNGNGGSYGTFVNALTDESGTSIQCDATNAVGVHFLQSGFTQTAYGINQTSGILQVANSWFWASASTAQIFNCTNGTLEFHNNYINNSATSAGSIASTAVQILNNTWVEANRTITVVDNQVSGVIAYNTTAGADVGVTFSVPNTNVVVANRQGLTRNQATETAFTIANNNSGGKVDFALSNDLGGISFGMYGSTKTPYGAIAAGSGWIYSGGNIPMVFMSEGGSSAPIIFAALTNSEKARIQNGLSVGTTTDPGTGRILASSGYQPPHLADSSAGNDTIYYSTTSNKLVYKDSGGTVNALY